MRSVSDRRLALSKRSGKGEASVSPPTEMTYELLKSILSYDPETGHFIWLIAPHGRYKCLLGKQAGTTNSHGYIMIKYLGKNYSAHRLAWLFMTKSWPPMDIDHKNQIKHDNSWDNLRLANNSQNNRNVGLTKRNVSGFKGVHRSHGKWRVAIQNKSLGHFDCKIEAARAYDKAAKELFGEFAILNGV